MEENKDYVLPPNGDNNESNIFSIFKNIYKYLHPNYWKRKLVHQIIVIPFCILIYPLIISGITGLWIGGIPVLIITIILTLLAAFFYPFSLYWYKQSFIGQVLNSIYHIGGFFQVIGKILLTIIGGVVIAGLMSPIMGILTYKKCVKKNMIIGDASDFE